MSFLVHARRRSFSSSPILIYLLGLFCFFVAPHALNAQVSTTGKIAGTVTDPSGAPFRMSLFR